MINAMPRIEDRLNKLRAELFALGKVHEDMVAAKQKADQEFQEKNAKHQSRFLQLQGAINELEEIVKENDDGKRSPDTK